MSDLVKQLRGPIDRPTRLVPLGNGTTTTGLALGTFSEDDRLHKEAADRIEQLEGALARSIAINERLLAIAGDVQHALKGGLRPPPGD